MLTPGWYDTLLPPVVLLIRVNVESPLDVFDRKAARPRAVTTLGFCVANIVDKASIVLARDI